LHLWRFFTLVLARYGCDTQSQLRLHILLFWPFFGAGFVCEPMIFWTAWIWSAQISSPNRAALNLSLSETCSSPEVEGREAQVPQALLAMIPQAR
jgi:hypothetical protein